MKDIQSLSTQKSSEENAQPIPNIMQSFPYHSVSTPNRNSLLKALTSLPLEHFEWATTPNSTSKSELRWDLVTRRLKTSREYRSMASRDRESSWAEVERLSSWGDAPYSHWYITKEKSHINLDLCCLNVTSHARTREAPDSTPIGTVNDSSSCKQNTRTISRIWQR